MPPRSSCAAATGRTPWYWACAWSVCLFSFLCAAEAGAPSYAAFEMEGPGIPAQLTVLRRDLSLAELERVVRMSYDRAMNLACVDREGDLVQLHHDFDLGECVNVGSVEGEVVHRLRLNRRGALPLAAVARHNVPDAAGGNDTGGWLLQNEGDNTTTMTVPGRLVADGNATAANVFVAKHPEMWADQALLGRFKPAAEHAPPSGGQVPSSVPSLHVGPGLATVQGAGVGYTLAGGANGRLTPRSPTLARRQRILAAFAARGWLRGHTFMEVGSGCGFLAWDAWHRGATRVVAIEADPRQADITARVADAFGIHGVSSRIGNASSVQSATMFADVVVAFSVRSDGAIGQVQETIHSLAKVTRRLLLVELVHSAPTAAGEGHGGAKEDTIEAEQAAVAQVLASRFDAYQQLDVGDGRMPGRTVFVGWLGAIELGPPGGLPLLPSLASVTLPAEQPLPAMEFADARTPPDATAAPPDSAAQVRPEDVLVGVVVDQGPKFIRQALLWLQSLRWFGSTLNRATVLVCVMPGVLAADRQQLRDLGAVVIEVLPITQVLPNATPHTNKLRLLQQAQLWSGHHAARRARRREATTAAAAAATERPPQRRPSASDDGVGDDAADADHPYRVLLYMDCDVLVLGDPVPLLRTDAVMFRSGRVLWGQVAMVQPVARLMFEMFGVRPDVAENAIGWVNTGVLAFPARHVARFTDAWLDASDKFAHLLDKFGEDMYFLDQLSFIAAAGVADAPLRRWPIQMNCQLNLALNDFERNGFLLQLAHGPPPILVQHTGHTLRLSPSGGYPLPFSDDDVRRFPFLSQVNRDLHRMLQRYQEEDVEWVSLAPSGTATAVPGGGKRAPVTRRTPSASDEIRIACIREGEPKSPGGDTKIHLVDAIGPPTASLTEFTRALTDALYPEQTGSQRTARFEWVEQTGERLELWSEDDVVDALAAARTPLGYHPIQSIPKIAMWLFASLSEDDG